ncbi:hypothetical protein MD484_g954, partial [Candolleomyces efflorescens]
MLARIFSIALVSSLLLLVAAVPGGHGNGSHDQVNQCNNGKVYCCNQTQDVQSIDKKTSLILDLLDVNVSNLQGLVGSNCSPITAVGIGSGASCLSQQVCCEKNYNSATDFLNPSCFVS